MTNEELLQLIEQAARDEVTELDLRGRGVTKLPREIGQLSKLESLNLSFNRIASLPPEIGQLFRLIRLDLSLNWLTRLPNEISQLSNLKIFYSNGNRLTALPPEIKQLSKLEILDLRNNYLSIPPEILGRVGNPPVIINYYLQYLTSQRKRLNEAKLLLVGQGGVGKTSLVQRLIENRFNPAENKTEGIAIRQWPLTLKNQQIRLNSLGFWRAGDYACHAPVLFDQTQPLSVGARCPQQRGAEPAGILAQNDCQLWRRVAGDCRRQQD
ncbi:MAG: hypothetical protein DPW09_04190 [Anaerolineae bacterium]|nr:hypothetical protein [Anaerolineales bacterium]MCQ3972631.1 hypothetical protein [Anaerolineae bacterium]